MFLTKLHYEGKCASTIRTYSSAISYMNKINGHPDPAANFMVKEFLKGLSRMEVPKSQPTRLPITLPLLHKLIDKCNFPNQYDTVAFKALLLLTFHACLRAGEIVSSANNCHTLNLQQVSLLNTDPPAYCIKFQSFKHSNGKVYPPFVLKSSDNKLYCPVLHLTRYLDARKSSRNFLFVTEEGDPFPRKKFSAQLKSAINKIGLNPKQYNIHSLRIGRATQLNTDRCDHKIIQITGRWKSSAYLNYIRPELFVIPR